ncbi:hypothetical protein BGY98DRAFT_928452 [Russula aff. rugulosa BPL654]|nr:hypothetical protein BGY98DRAFT_928452 [Russula aff. rugulosa BPL654]
MPQDLYRPHLSTFAPIGTQPEINDDVLRYKNKTVQLIMDWQNTRSSIKSNEEVTRLVHDVVLHPDFTVDELLNFSAARENQKADAAEHEATFPQAFQQIAVNIKVPSGNKDVPPKTLAIPGLSFRKITTLIRDEFEGPMFMKFHLSPFKLFCKHPHQNKDERIYSEMTDSDVFIDEHDKVQRAPTDDPACKREKVIAVLMFWSDATHLATFGTAKMWPVYMQFGNVSKYVRCQPTSGATKHVAYIPSLSDSVQDEIKHFHVKWDTQQRDILTHCRRELMHGVWKVLLDEDFLHATSYGMVVRCHDGIERRVYPRILTYSADYPEKVLIATIRDQGLCPCPRCLVPKTKLDQMGSNIDMKNRTEKARKYLPDNVRNARRAIYKLGMPIGGVAVARSLKETSSVPTSNAFVERLGQDFDLSRMLVVDFMHEFELGVWKTLFTHLIRILYAAAPAGRLVAILDERYDNKLHAYQCYEIEN